MLAVVVGTSFAQPGEEWEFRVCVRPHDYPASSRDRGGYEIRIAEILADELDARLTFEWTTFDQVAIERSLHAGSCDAAIGMGEGVTGVESTVPFLRAPYVFVTRAMDGIEVQSLDDGVLEELTIGTYQDGLPTTALVNRGIQRNVREYPPVASASGPDRESAILDALLAGEIDIAIVYGPPAVGRAAEESVELDIVPVSPEMDVGRELIQMFRIWTIGVRPHDEAFRDRLNAALAARWDEVVDAIADFGVPQLAIPRPVQLAEAAPSETRVGVVVPSRTQRDHPYVYVGEAARLGAELARYHVARQEGDVSGRFKVLDASAPSPESAVRAAGRLAAAENVIALVGGFGLERARALSEEAERRGVVFFNVASNADELRGPECRRSTFHVEASASMYADAAVAWYSSQGADTWYVVHTASRAGESLASHVGSALASRPEGGSLLGSSSVDPGQLVHTREVKAVLEAEPDVLLLSLPAEELDQFLAQMSGQAPDLRVTTIPDASSQTRVAMQRLREAAPDLASSPRPALWETSITSGAAGDINDAYTSRTGEPMEPTAWATYAAVLTVFQAAEAGSTGDAAELATYLEDRGTSFGDGLGKDRALSFRPWDHQLRQPIYMVAPVPDATWGRRLGPRIDLARLIGVVPPLSDDENTYREELDLLGVGPEATACRF